MVVHDGGRDFIWCGAGRDRVVADALDAVAPDCESTTTPARLHRLEQPGRD